MADKVIGRDSNWEADLCSKWEQRPNWYIGQKITTFATAAGSTNTGKFWENTIYRKKLALLCSKVKIIILFHIKKCVVIRMGKSGGAYKKIKSFKELKTIN